LADLGKIANLEPIEKITLGEQVLRVVRQGSAVVVKGAVRWLIFKAKESTLDLLGDLEILLQPPQSAGVEMRTAIQIVENITFLKCSQDLLYNAGFPNVIPVTLMFSSKNMPIPLPEVAV
jgi:hypothetical protein